MDLDERDWRLQEHLDIIDDLAVALDAAGYQPLDPLSPACAYDLAWQRGTRLHIVEVKTTTPASEVQQIRSVCSGVGGHSPHHRQGEVSCRPRRGRAPSRRSHGVRPARAREAYPNEVGRRATGVQLTRASASGG